jgi:hypothetical protein
VPLKRTFTANLLVTKYIYSVGYNTTNAPHQLLGCGSYKRVMKLYGYMGAIAVAPYFLFFLVFFLLALIATAPHTWLLHRRHAEAMQSSCSAHSASFASRITGYLVTRPFLDACLRASPFPSKSCD